MSLPQHIDISFPYGLAMRMQEVVQLIINYQADIPNSGYAEIYEEIERLTNFFLFNTNPDISLYYYQYYDLTAWQSSGGRKAGEIFTIDFQTSTILKV